MESRILSEVIPFVPASRTLDFSAVLRFDLGQVVSIVNQTKGVVLYAPAFGTAFSYSSYSSSTKILTLAYDTTTHSSGDKIQVRYAALQTENGAMSVGNANRKFHDNFSVLAPDPAVWDESWVNQGTSFVERGGDTAGANYLRICVDPLMPECEYILTSKDMFQLPSRFGFSFSQSQRMLGHEFAIELVGCDSLGNIEVISQPADLTISGTITIASNVATINFATTHTAKGGDRVILFGNTYSPLNVGPVVVTPVTPLQITVPCTAANGTYTAGGYVRFADPCKLASNAAGALCENGTTTNATTTSRRNGSSPRQVNTTISTVTATQTNTSPYSDSFNSANQCELIASLQEFMLISRSADGISAPSGQQRFTQGIPNELKWYKMRLRSKTLKNLTRPVAKVTNALKSGSTTATLTLDTDLTAVLSASNSFLAVSGIRLISAADFPNLTATAVTGVTSTTVTIPIGSGTANGPSAGGGVMLVQGGTALAGLSALAVQSISRTNNILTITVNTTATGALPGEYWQMYGCDATSMGLYDGCYKVRRMTGSTYEADSVGADFGSINCGGMFFKRVEHRVHGITELEYTRHIVEMFNQHGAVDAARALPVAPVSLPTLAAVTTLSTLTSMSQVAGIPANGLIYDTQHNAWANSTRKAIA